MSFAAKRLTEQRTRYVQQLLERERGELSELERHVVESLAPEETVARNIEAAWAGSCQVRIIGGNQQLLIHSGFLQMAIAGLVHFQCRAPCLGFKDTDTRGAALIEIKATPNQVRFIDATTSAPQARLSGYTMAKAGPLPKP